MTHSYGWKRDLPDQRDRVFLSGRVVGLLPPPPDLDLRPLQPPIFDQGKLGSCTGNGIAGELEAQAMAQGETPVVLRSRLFIYYNERVMEKTVRSDAGASIRDGIKSVAKQGCCAESEWPYIVDQFAVEPNPQAYSAAKRWKALTYESVLQSLASIKTALASCRGIVFGIPVYESFETDAVTQTGIVPMPAPTERMLGGHCVRLVGYTDNGINGIPPQHFIGANSWGTGWGLAGYFAIPYDYVVNLASDLWLIQTVS